MNKYRIWDGINKMFFYFDLDHLRFEPHNVNKYTDGRVFPSLRAVILTGSQKECSEFSFKWQADYILQQCIVEGLYVGDIIKNNYAAERYYERSGLIVRSKCDDGGFSIAFPITKENRSLLPDDIEHIKHTVNGRHFYEDTILEDLICWTLIGNIFENPEMI